MNASVNDKTQVRGRKIELEGRVVSDKMNKTVSVEVFRLVKHAKYGKYVRRSAVYKAHDEHNVAKNGEQVLIRESRPLSKTKRWRLVKVLNGVGSTKPEGGQQ